MLAWGLKELANRAIYINYNIIILLLGIGVVNTRVGPSGRTDNEIYGRANCLRFDPPSSTHLYTNLLLLGVYPDSG